MNNFKNLYFSSKWKLWKKEYNKLSIKWYIIFFINFFSINIPILLLILNIDNFIFVIITLIIIIFQCLLFIPLSYSGYCLNRKRANDLWYKSIYTNIIDLFKKD